MASQTLDRTVTDNRVVVRTALVVFAVGQAVASALVAAYGGAFTTANRPGEPLIVPPGPAFSIWSVIIAISIAYSVWAWPRRQPDLEIRNRLATPLLIVTVGFSLWLVAAELEPVWTTLLVFVGLFGSLLWALKIARQSRSRIAQWSLLGRSLLWGTLGLYTGWTSIAIWLNIATAMAGSGAPLTGTAGTLGQLAILLGATATAAAILRYTGGLAPYAAASAWGLGGAALGAYLAGAYLLAAVGAAGLTVVLVGFGAERFRRRRVVQA
jgi:hypothetical protein